VGLAIAVDANVILPALVGGAAAHVLFDPRYEFLTTEFTYQEVRRYLPRLAKQANIPQPLVEQTLLLLPIRRISKKIYRSHLRQAKHLIAKRDPNDAELLALALALHCPVLSHDKDFEGLPIQLVKIKDLF